MACCTYIWFRVRVRVRVSFGVRIWVRLIYHQNSVMHLLLSFVLYLCGMLYCLCLYRRLYLLLLVYSSPQYLCCIDSYCMYSLFKYLNCMCMWISSVNVETLLLYCCYSVRWTTVSLAGQSSLLLQDQRSGVYEVIKYYNWLVLLRLSKPAPKRGFLAISNPIETAVLGSLLTVSVFQFLEQHSSRVLSAGEC